FLKPPPTNLLFCYPDLGSVWGLFMGGLGGGGLNLFGHLITPFFGDFLRWKLSASTGIACGFLSWAYRSLHPEGFK
ncbi:MAG: hypothetical protein ACK2T7_13825, partial [Anaerolineales bacterium]